ncbi:MAG: glucuronyl hydrolase [Bacteroidota bacterium]
MNILSLKLMSRYVLLGVWISLWSCQLKPLPDAVVLSEQEIDLSEVRDSALHDLKKLSHMHVDTTRFPRSWDGKKQSLILDPDYIWTSGFYAGCLWKAYAMTGDTTWLPKARTYTWAMRDQSLNKSTHDLGFMIMNSFGQGVLCEENTAWDSVLLTAAQTLKERFVPAVGAIQSYGSLEERMCPVIIDNLMNLELLFWASRQTGDTTFARIAELHADFSLQNHQRSDGSMIHVIVWDKEEKKWNDDLAGQGKSEKTTWSRGQAWAIYGFGMVYQYTGDVRFLHAAQAAAAYWLNRLPNHEVPFWDFDLVAGDPPFRDASAAAIATVGLLRLADWADDAHYRSAAQQTFIRLSQAPYRDSSDPFILSHAVGSVPHAHDVDRPLIYADYYYLEALTYLLENEKKAPYLEKNRKAAATNN